MARNPNTTKHGGSFSIHEVEAIWRKGQIQQGYDPKFYRKDRCGQWMKRLAYGTTSDYGWEIDHMRPVSRGGSDELTNLQPLHWKNNRGKGDSYPQWYCSLPVRV